MGKKPFILKDGELILRKPINLDEVPEPPEEYKQKNISSSNVFKVGLGITVLLLLLAVFIIPQVIETRADLIDNTYENDILQTRIKFSDIFSMVAEKEEIDKLEIDNAFKKIRGKGIKHEINLVNKEKTFNKDIDYSILIEIDYNKIRWGGQEYVLTKTPQKLEAYSYKGRTITPNIFFGKEDARINFEDITKEGGYALIYEEDKKYIIELRIDGISIDAGKNYYLDPKYYKETDGFSTAAFGSGTPNGITTNGTDLWIVDETDFWVYHINYSGYNYTDGFDIVGAVGTPTGITTNGTDLWINSFTETWTAQFGVDGANMSRGFTSGFNRGITMANDTTFLATINDRLFIRDINGNNLTGGFDADEVAGISNGYGITTNGTLSSSSINLWMTDCNDHYLYHVIDGVNQTDGIDLNEFSISGCSYITTKAYTHANGGNINEFWLSVDGDDYVYHIKESSVVISLQFPKDDNADYTPYVNFTYIVTHDDNYEIDNCSIYINSILNQTDDTIYNPFNGSGQVGEWLFEGDADDTSGNGNDGVVTGATLTTGHYGGGYEFDGLNDYINISNLDEIYLADNQTFSVSGWIYPKAKSSSGVIFTLEIGPETQLAWYAPDSANRVANFLYKNITGDTNYFNQLGTTTPETWNHFVGIIDNLNYTLYVNGEYDRSVLLQSTENQTSNRYVRIGSVKNSLYFNGTIDEVAIYNRALSQAEITTLYEKGLHAINQTFNLTTLDYGDLDWYVNCYDNNSIYSNSLEYNYSRYIAYPQITLTNPPDNNFTKTKYVNFTYTPSIFYNSIEACYLWFNDFELNATDTSITEDISQTFNITLNNTHTWNWKIECKSNIGYRENSTTRTLTLQNPPTTPSTLLPANQTTTVKDSMNLTCSGSTDAESDTIKYEFYGNNIYPPTTLKQNSTLTTYNWSSLNPDNYYWRCRANDNRNVSSYTPIRKFTSANLYANCSGTNHTSTIALNFTFAAENGTTLYNVDFDGDFDIWGTSSSINDTVSLDNTANQVLYCISPANATLNTDAVITYEKTGWKLRYYTLDNVALQGDYTNKTLYLLATADGVYVTFQVVNTAGQPIRDVFFTAERDISGWTTIYSQLTDDAGSVVPFLDPDYSHRFTFSKSGYDTYTTTLTPTQTTYTITLGEGAADINETIPSRAISFNILPVNLTLNNNTEYNFTFNVSSAYYALDNAGFTLTNGSGDNLGSASCIGDVNCLASLILDVGNNDYIIMSYYWTIDGTRYDAGKRTWYVYATYEGAYSIMKIFEDATLLGSGFGDFTKSIISFIFIISIVGVATLKFNLHNYSEGAILFLIAVLTAALDYVGFLPEIPKSIPHFIPIMMFIIAIGYIIYEFRR